jgi:hypothetical protein
VLIGPLSLPSLARTAAVQTPLSATISQLNKDDRTAFLFLYVFLFTEAIPTFFLEHSPTQFTSLPLLHRIPTKMIFILLFFFHFSGTLKLDDYIHYYIPPQFYT